MSIKLTELIVEQAKILGVMFCAGIAVESLWQLKNYAKGRARLKTRINACRLWEKAKSILPEAAFWPTAACIVCMFLYYCSYGKLSLYAAAAFFTGLILWKKVCCGILKEVWVENDEAENLKTTARSSISSRPESKGWKKGVRREKKKKRK